MLYIMGCKSESLPNPNRAHRYHRFVYSASTPRKEYQHGQQEQRVELSFYLLISFDTTRRYVGSLKFSHELHRCQAHQALGRALLLTSTPY